jgi:hypothetical protein
MRDGQFGQYGLVRIAVFFPGTSSKDSEQLLTSASL